MSSSASLWPAAIGVIGTIAGGILSAVVSVWNTKSTRRRDAELEAQRHALAEVVRQREQKLDAYRQWLRLVGDYMAGGQAPSKLVDGSLYAVAESIQLIAPDYVARATSAELKTIENLRARVTDRPGLLAELRQRHDETVNLMRQELAQTPGALPR